MFRNFLCKFTPQKGPVLVRVFMAVKRNHNKGNSHKEQHLNGDALQQGEEKSWRDK